MSGRILVTGASGRMGQMLIQAVQASDGVRLVGAMDRPGSSLEGLDPGAPAGLHTGVVTQTDWAQAPEFDVAIDFTRPEACPALLRACQQRGAGLVLGTTGFDDEGLAALDAFAQTQRLVFSPNMAVGVNITLKLLELAGAAMADGFDIEVIEAHHRHKVDAPSGTALKMAEVVATSSGRSLEADAVWTRKGHTGPRDPRAIGFSVIRGGDIIGDHTVLFAGEGERIEITHKSSSRATYAQGAVRAAKFLLGSPAGRYDMWDVLGLR